MTRYDDIVDSWGLYSEDLDMEDLALIDTVLDTLENDIERPGERKSMEWEADGLFDEF